MIRLLPRPAAPCLSCGRGVPPAEARVCRRALGVVHCHTCRRARHAAETRAGEAALALVVRPVGAFGLWSAYAADGSWLAGGMSEAAARANAALVLEKK